MFDRNTIKDIKIDNKSFINVCQKCKKSFNGSKGALLCDKCNKERLKRLKGARADEF